MNIMKEIKNLFGSFSKSEEKYHNELNQEVLIKNDKVVEDINCYKYCVDTHKYVLIGKVISKRGSQGELDEEVIFFSPYPIEDTHINRAYLYTWFYLLDDKYKSFTPKNEVRQLLYGSENNYVIGYLNENGEGIYYDQFVGAN